MLNAYDIIDTIKMIEEEHLDIRTVTMGISLVDCIRGSITETADRVYDKITSRAKNLVSVANEISKEYGVPIVNKRVSVTPISLVGGGISPEGYLKVAHALERAANAGIEGRVLARKDHESIAAYSKALADTMVSEKIDLVVLAGFLTIIDEQVYEAFPNRILNVHPALIPSFCGKGFYGLHVHEAALAKGVKVSGATVHIVTPECDAGPIVLQKAVEVKEDDTPETLQRRIMEEAEWKILPEAVRLFCDGKITVEDNKVHIKN